MIRKILDILFDSRYEKIVVIGLPIFAILLSIMIIAPSIVDIIHLTKVNAASQSSTVGEAALAGSNAVAASSSAAPTPAAAQATSAPATAIPAATATPAAATVQNVHLTCTTVQSDLYIFVRDTAGYPVQGNVFSLVVHYPDGQTANFSTNTDGSCYLTNLASGTYTVSMNSKDGYSVPDPVSCSVSNTISYEKIDEIEDIVEVKDAAEVQGEIKINESEAPVEVVPEEIDSQEELAVAYSDTPVLDSSGHQTYKYSYNTINGHLIGADGQETNVIPIEEDGQLIFGLMMDSENNSSYTVELFNPDNTPVSDYQISYEPIMQEENVVAGWKYVDGAVYYMESDGNYATGLKSIDNQIYYFDCYGRKASSVGIDVSFYNGTINWQAVRNSGIDFAILRVGGRGWSTGLMYDDSCFYNYLIGATSAGLKVGVYFYSTAVNPVEAVQEASIVLDRLSNVSLDMPIFIDMEYSGDYPEGRSDLLSMAQRVNIALTFCKTVNNYGYQAGIYSSQSFLTDCLDAAAISPYCIWLANYTENNQLPSYASRYDIWQFTDRGHVPGVNGNCDLNIIS